MGAALGLAVKARDSVAVLAAALGSSGTGAATVLPDVGHVLLLDADGSLLTDPDGAYIQEPA